MGENEQRLCFYIYMVEMSQRKKKYCSVKKVIFVCKQNEKFRKIGNSAAFSLWPYTFEK